MSDNKDKTNDVNLLNTSLLGDDHDIINNSINHDKEAGAMDAENGADNSAHLETEVVNPHFINQPATQETFTHKVQSTTLYWTINDANEKGKFLQDLCDVCSQEVSKLPARCVKPCHYTSIALFAVVLLMYLISIFMAYPYAVYTMKYKDIDGIHHTTSILINDIKDHSTVDALYNENVCQFYDMNCALLDHKNDNKLNNYTNDISLTKLSDYDIALIKLQWVVSWLTWLEIRVNMLEIELVCVHVTSLHNCKSVISVHR